MKRRLLDIVPFALGALAVVITYIGWKQAAHSVDETFGNYLMNQKTDLTLALMTLVIQYIITVAILQEIDSELSGKWEVIMSPTNWKGRTDPKTIASVIGRGTLILSKVKKTTNSYTGILQLTYSKMDNNNRIITHNGVYEVFLLVARTFHFKFNSQRPLISLWQKEIIGWSLATVVEKLVSPDPDDIDYPTQNKCLYNLSFDPSALTLIGTAKMQEGASESNFEAHKLN